MSSLEALYRVLRISADPALVKDEAYTICFANDAFLDFVGRQGQDVVGRTDFDLFPREEAEASRGNDKAALEQGSELRTTRETLTGTDEQTVNWSTLRVPTREDGTRRLVAIYQGPARRDSSRGPASVPDEALERHVRERTVALRSAQNTRLKNERLIIVGQLASGLAHQIRNPLGAISNALALLRRHATPKGSEIVTQALDIAEEEVWAANRILTDLLDYSRIRTAELSTIRIASLVDAALEAESTPPEVTVVRRTGSEEALADFRQATDAVSKLIRNAIEAMEGRGTLTFETGYRQAYAELRITDTGVGIAPAAAELLFEPLVSSKPLGIGLGLAAARALINNQGGSLSCESVEGGAQFVVRLPRPISHREEPSA